MSDHQNSGPIGRVVGLWRYPVKSMAPEPLTEIEVSWHGFAGDRRWAFIREEAPRSGFPWLTIRERADMSHYVPTFADPAKPDRSPVIVRTPSGASYDVLDGSLATELYPSGARVIKQNRGIFDTFPLSLITTHSIGALAERVGAQLEVQRFRPNILVEASSSARFAEDDWVGCVLRIGGMRMRVDKRDGRCSIITIDPLTMARNPAVLQTLARDRESCLGVYGSTVQPGRLAVGDPVFIDSRA
jgi:MOSC domain-containing protein